MSPESRRKLIDATVLAALALAIRLLWFTGPNLVDDVIYSESAVQLWREGWPTTDSIYSLRIGFVGLRALAIGCFGAGPFSLTLPSLTASIALTVLAYTIGLRLFERRIGLAAGVFVAFNPADVFFATEGHTDLSLAALTAGAFLLIRERECWAWSRCLSAGILIGIGHLFKEMAILPALVLAGILVMTRRTWKPAATLLAGYGAILLLEGAIYWIARGDFFHRFNVVRSVQSANLFSPIYLESVPTARRLLVDFPSLLFNPANVHAAFAGALGWWMAISGGYLVITRRRSLIPLLGWSIAILVLLNFWPISLSPYRPALVAYPWLLVHLSLPVAVASGFVWNRLLQRSRTLGWGAAGATILFSILCFRVVQSDARIHQEPVRAVLDHLPSGCVIVTDPRTRSLARAYRGFPDDGSIRTWNDPRPSGQWYYVENPFWLNLLATQYRVRPPEDLRSIRASQEAFFTTSATGRLRWRPLLEGRIERTTSPTVRVYRVGP